MTTQNSATEADRALKAKHRAMWAQGDYPSLAAEVIPGLGAVLVEACGVRSGQRVLDVGAGSGNAAIPAALAGAEVVASDLTPELFEAGRRVAGQQGVELSWQEADAEALPFGDAEFDTVLSCVGVMFAPHHQRAADELVRVCRPGGTIGLLSWTPQGFIGRMFATMKPYAPPPPPGAQPPPLWGDEDHVRALLGDRVTDVRAERRTVRVDRFETPEAFRDYFKERYGPTISVYKSIAGDSGRTAALDRDLVDLARDGDPGPGGVGGLREWEYLLFTARRAG
ncbi:MULTISPECIES: class I SAM-dependent methyltransferase [Streptomyces]|uniref:Putative methyltransferase YcgJ n=1 Tax=Streptomyces chartreusis NRRL 3882 TaxID=1079985 RepID=A0A2N9BCD9_STRCX|nr:MULTISPECIES: methyltransferase domain-containing protein [Streptomyces]MYS90283.1 methyltransferase domain-containing protein [Streptomyces sp. SID5464]SOR81000.1 putative methyltransferase YcgJ [Streptomyces chartreusis NRRL 3882]